MKPEPFETMKWQVAGDNSKRPITLVFDPAQKRASGFSGCNRYAGTYTIDHNQLTFGPLLTTRMACAEDARNKTERQFQDALTYVDSYLFDGETLTLFDANAAQLLRFRVMPDDASANAAK